MSTTSLRPRRTCVAAGALLLTIAGCAGIPKGVEAVRGFDLERYLGTWYEIARLDHRFERGLTDISAAYRLRDDGSIEVVNRGYSPQEEEWKEAIGKAHPVDRPDVGRLKVSFFGPFYGGYNIIALDHADYRYSMVAGPDRSYLWILARSPDLDQAILDRLVARAQSLGFATDGLIVVEHGVPPPERPFRNAPVTRTSARRGEFPEPQGRRRTPASSDRIRAATVEPPTPKARTGTEAH